MGLAEAPDRGGARRQPPPPKPLSLRTRALGSVDVPLPTHHRDSLCCSGCGRARTQPRERKWGMDALEGGQERHFTKWVGFSVHLIARPASSHADTPPEVRSPLAINLGSPRPLHQGKCGARTQPGPSLLNPSWVKFKSPVPPCQPVLCCGNGEQKGRGLAPVPGHGICAPW